MNTLARIPIIVALALLVGCETASVREPHASLVGRAGGNRIVTPVNQSLTPEGIQVSLPGMRPQVIALSPDGKFLVTSGKTNKLVIVDPATRKISQRVTLPKDKLDKPQGKNEKILKPDDGGQVSYTGLVFSPDGKRIYLSNVGGSVKVSGVGDDGKVAPQFSIALPLAKKPRRKEEIPAGLALSPDGARLYVAMSFSNRLGEFDAATGKQLRLFDVGVAPYDVALVGGKIYVSNWGGRRPQEDDTTGPAGHATKVKVDPVRFIASEGSVSVIDLASGATLKEIIVHLHSSALTVSPDRRYVVAANAASDNLSVIDTRSDEVVETIWVKQSPADLFGASPNALAFDKSGKTLYVANGTQNAVAVVAFDPGKSKLLGLIPVGWFPGALAFDAQRNTLCVANIKGIGNVKKKVKNTTGSGYNSHQYFGSLSLIPVPKPRDLPRLSAIVWQNYRREQIAATALPPRPDQPPRPVPERIGEPSVFQHVVYVIKENRSYDQVLGDDARGNGDPKLVIFGDKVTPNQHKIAREFVLLDNTYCCGILSADGHQWCTTAFATDYMEKSFADFPRSYPDGMGADEVDALAYAPSGFLWDNALAHGKTLRDYGEFAIPAVKWNPKAKKKGDPKWTDCWNDFNNSKGDVIFAVKPGVESLRPYMPLNYIGWALEVPDQYRAKFFINELRQFEQKGEFPQLVLICLPDDHTSGTDKGYPTPAAQVADNDLAFGQIIEAISRSKFWKDTVIFCIEDDPQDGWDHVSGYRTTAFCVSPYTKRSAVVSAQYNTTSIIRTIEQILGLPPMNQFDATATPMSDCFTDQPDLTPFAAVPNNIPLTQMNPDPKKIADAVLRRDAEISARLNFKKADACPEDTLNKILWHAMKGSAAPYPTWVVTVGAREGDD